ncbi:hypothetical protein BMW22_06810 [Rhizobium leguminosarum]|uniref:Uncharacterized protein n=1 Tax=Rhizobium leguminosarum TaxID=384 RepID=A0A1L3Z6R8_RHILE|nr:hypothetical protein [Rhizobium leguminosarum]API51376.1 hypothetical protein BMW22_06810 [Rhizobium leguminosarum]
MNGNFLPASPLSPIGPVPILLFLIFLFLIGRILLRRSTISLDSVFAILMVAVTISSLALFRRFRAPDYVFIFLTAQIVIALIFFPIAWWMARRAKVSDAGFFYRLRKNPVENNMKQAFVALTIETTACVIIYISDYRLTTPCNNAKCYTIDFLIGSRESGFFNLYMMNTITSIFVISFFVHLYNIYLKTIKYRESS